MKDHPETPEPQPCRHIEQEEIQELTRPTPVRRSGPVRGDVRHPLHAGRRHPGHP